MAVRTAKGRHVIEFQLAGVRVHERCPAGTTRAQAQEREANLRAEIYGQRKLGRRPVVPLAAAIESWLRDNSRRKAARQTRNHANALADYVAGKTVTDIVAVADRYRNVEGLAPATINARLNVLKAVAKYAMRKGWTDDNASARIPLLTVHNARHVYLTPKQIAALLRAHPDDESRAFSALAVYTGMRQGELYALRREQIGRDVIDLGVNTKTGAPRRIPIIAQARPYLRFVPWQAPLGRLVPAARQARRDAGIGHVTFHDLRHCTASLLAQAGVDLLTISRILGNPSAVQRYAHLSDESTRAAMQKLAGALRRRA